MKRMIRLLSLILGMMLLVLPVLAEEAEEDLMNHADSEWNEAEEEQDLAALEAAGIETEGFDEEEEAAHDDSIASIAGLKPLYTTKIKPFTASGSAIRMRALQDPDSEVVCAVKAGETITIYAVYPTYVLAEWEGNVGYIIRTWIDEYVTPVDAANIVPYGVVPSKYVAALIDTVNIYDAPSTDSTFDKIHPTAGSKIAILDFTDGFAKVLCWRHYGYIEVSKLTDLVVVSQNGQPLSEDTPIAAFCSFFEFNTGKEGNDGRCKNIVRSCELMTRVMQPGESLDFNAQIGPYKRANGYFPAPVLINGGSQLGYGGGTCQSSSTLYNTVRQIPGINIIYRRPHGPGCAKYLPMHQDAAVGSDVLNFIFRNDCGYPIRILAESTGEGTLCIQIFKGE